MATTSVPSSTPSRMSLVVATDSDGIFMSEWLTTWSPANRSSTRGLKSWTFWRAIWARRTRRISSSLLPLNMLPVMTSIHPDRGCGVWFMFRGMACAGSGLLGALDVGPGAGIDPDPVAFGDEGWHLHGQARLRGRRLVLVGNRGALDRRLGGDDRHLHHER